MWNCIAAAQTLHPAQVPLWHPSLITSPQYFPAACTVIFMCSLITISAKCRLTAHTPTDGIFLILQVWSCAVQGGQRLCNGQLLQQQKVGGLPTPRKWAILFKTWSEREKEITRKTVWDFYDFSDSLFPICSYVLFLQAAHLSFVWLGVSSLTCGMQENSVCYVRTRIKALYFDRGMGLQSTGSVL